MKSIIGLAVVAVWAFTNVVEAQKTLEEIATHSTANNCWTAVGGTAYEITNFIPSHPNNEILFMCGRDGTRVDALQGVSSQLAGPRSKLL